MALTARLVSSRRGPLHAMAPHHKVAATVAWVFCVALTPRRALAVFAVHAAVAVVVLAASRLPLGLVLRRMRVEVPFVAFALVLPIVGQGPRVNVAGLALSETGLWAMWSIVSKATLGVLAAVVLAATTPVADVLSGLERLRAPRLFVAIAGFMVRYADVVADDLRRMRIARLSRGDDPRWLWQARAVAATAGTLFVRAFERGERVHLAMVARGYTGTLPVLAPLVPVRHGPAALAPVAVSAAALALWWLR